MNGAPISASPLQWPIGWRRTASAARTRARFGKAASRSGDRWIPGRDLTIAEGLGRVKVELSRMNVSPDDLVVSTNLTLRLDGLPRSDQREPADPGAAVYWIERGGERRVMAIDVYDRVADNLAAIAATLEAMRAIERHGGAVVLERAFTGFLALPPPETTLSLPRDRTWREVLGFEGFGAHLISAELLRERHRSRVRQHHPDRPDGDAAEMAAVNVAYEQAKKELGYV